MSRHLPISRVGFPRDFDYCRQVIQKGSKSFHFASLLLPADVRRAAFATYAFCRLADDEVDLGSDPREALAEVYDRLDQIYRGYPEDHPIDRAFASIVHTYALPRALPEALLEGMRWDTSGRRYQTLEDLYDYAARVAGTVGAMMAVLMGTRSKLALARACDLGIAMQLTNVARDVGEDARAGRLYLPLDWFDEAGIDPDTFLRQPRSTEAVRGLVKRLLDAADPIYARGVSGVSLLPSNCQTSIAAAGKIYKEIGQEIRRNHYDSVDQRAVVTKRKKMKLLLEAAVEPVSETVTTSAMAVSQFLVSAVDSTRLIEPDPIPPTPLNWTIDLFLRLEQRQRAV